MSLAIDRDRDALLVVDLQPDFMPGGALPVPGGDLVVEPIARLVSSRLVRTVVATQDWHPRGHRSFASSHPGKAPFDVVELHDKPQTLWPDHCVQGSPGAELHRGLPLDPVLAVIRKGEDPDIDSYSALWNNYGPGGDRRPTGLGGYLEARDIRRVLLCGLALDFCVAWTARDAVATGLEVVLLRDLSRPVLPEGEGEILEGLAAAGVVVARSEDLAEPRR